MALLFLDIEVFEKCFSLILRFLQHCWRGNDGSRWHDDNFVIPLLVSGISC
ncbi:hypothetical protein [Wolbachia endosymbiont (group A) of Rhinocyllus conicus]|uniref:hypothetical protein n=1 Tax=Wolbachia endosymbiont (group A) of Rhinocyllus conicus TaxID=2954053 RepID=UPI0022276853|nr:hypothetical protein [Wolbachia endosymbiont (group A) of Rhinocyllus conicus]